MLAGGNKAVNVAVRVLKRFPMILEIAVINPILVTSEASLCSAAFCDHKRGELQTESQAPSTEMSIDNLIQCLLDRGKRAVQIQCLHADAVAAHPVGVVAKRAFVRLRVEKQPGHLVRET